MKIIFYLIIFLFLFNNSYHLNQPKDIFISFLKEIKKDDIIDNLSDQCLGNLFNYFFFSFKKSYKENNFENLSKNLENMVLDTFINCPIKELFSFFKSTEYEIFSPLGFKYKSKIYTKILTLNSILYLHYKNKTLNSTYIGSTCGKIFNLFKFDYSELYDLEVDADDDNDNDEIDSILEKINNEIFNFIEGVFIGMKKRDDGRESECFNDIIKGKRKILNYIEKGLKKMDTGIGFLEAIKSSLFNLVTVDGLTVDCNLLRLGNNILNKVNSFKKMKKLFFTIIRNSKIYFEKVKQFYEKIRNKKTKEAGKLIGNIISDIFDFNIK